MHIA